MLATYTAPNKMCNTNNTPNTSKSQKEFPPPKIYKGTLYLK